MTASTYDVDVDVDSLGGEATHNFQRIQSSFYFVNQTMGLADHYNLYEVMIYLDQLKEYVVIVG